MWQDKHFIYRELGPHPITLVVAKTNTVDQSFCDFERWQTLLKCCLCLQTNCFCRNLSRIMLSQPLLSELRASIERFWHKKWDVSVSRPAGFFIILLLVIIRGINNLLFQREMETPTRLEVRGLHLFSFKLSLHLPSKLKSEPLLQIGQITAGLAAHLMTWHGKLTQLKNTR